MLELSDQAALVLGQPHNSMLFCACCDVEGSTEIHTMALECFVLKVTHVYTMLGNATYMTTLSFTG